VKVIERDRTSHTRQRLKARCGEPDAVLRPSGERGHMLPLLQLEHPAYDSDARNERRHDVESLYSLGKPFFLGVVCIAR